MCGALLARSHARTGDIAKIAGYIGKADAFASVAPSSRKLMATKPSSTTQALVAAVAAGGIEARDEGES